MVRIARREGTATCALRRLLDLVPRIVRFCVLENADPLGLGVDDHLGDTGELGADVLLDHAGARMRIGERDA